MLLFKNVLYNIVNLPSLQGCSGKIAYFLNTIPHNSIFIKNSIYIHYLILKRISRSLLVTKKHYKFNKNQSET